MKHYTRSRARVAKLLANRAARVVEVDRLSQKWDNYFGSVTGFSDPFLREEPNNPMKIKEPTVQLAQMPSSSARDRAIVEEFIASWNLIRVDSLSILDTSLLPVRLEALANRMQPGYFWRAWLDGARLRFVAMRLTCSGNAYGLRPRMDAGFYDNFAELAGAGSWERVSPGRWQLINCLESTPQGPWHHDWSDEAPTAVELQPPSRRACSQRTRDVPSASFLGIAPRLRAVSKI
jgi:hypothetical protein